MPTEETSYGARFVAEMLQFTEPTQILDKVRLRRLERLGFEEIAEALRARYHWLGPAWVDKMRGAPPEDVARAIVREETTRSQGAPESSGVAAFLEVLLNLAMFT